MPVHDWKKVGDCLFHDFHTGWLIYLRNALNGGLLPAGYRAYAEQRAELYGPDVLALSTCPRPTPQASGPAVAVAEPQAERRVVVHSVPVPGRLLTIRHASDQRVVAVIEIVSRLNKDRATGILEFTDKIAGLLRSGIHAAVIDILPPGRHDPDGPHPAICNLLDPEQPTDRPPEGRPLTVASYRADDSPVAFLSYTAVGRVLPDLPLFLDDGAFVSIPLEATYMIGYDQLTDELKAELK